MAGAETEGILGCTESRQFQSPARRTSNSIASGHDRNPCRPHPARINDQQLSDQTENRFGENVLEKCLQADNYAYGAWKTSTIRQSYRVWKKSRL